MNAQYIEIIITIILDCLLFHSNPVLNSDMYPLGFSGILAINLRDFLLGCRTATFRGSISSLSHPLQFACIRPLVQNMVDPEVLTQLFNAAVNDRVEELEDLIGKNGVDINVCQKVD